MAGGDFSGCVEFSASYSNLLRFDSGKIGVSFDCTGDEQKAIVGKDPTVDLSGAAFYLEYLQLGCTTTFAKIYDGSDGAFIAGILASDVSGQGPNSQVWDFRGDALRCLTAESTSGLCLSCGDGRVSGFLKGYWGVKA